MTRTPRLGPTCALLASGSLLVSACDEPVTPPPGPEPSTVLAVVEMLPAERHFGVLGTRARLGALRVADDGSVLGGSSAYPERFSWSSDAPDVATVDSLGWVTSIGEGTARITATSEGIVGTAVVTVEDAARLSWTLPLDLESHPNAGIAIGRDGTAYVGTASQLWAVDPAGGVRWAVPAPGGVQSAPAIAEDGTVYFGTAELAGGQSLIAVDPGGSVLWRLDSLHSVLASPAIAVDGTIYVATSADTASTVRAISPRGEEEWAFGMSGRVLFSSPAIAADGGLYVGTLDGRLYALGPDGTERWRLDLPGEITGPVSIGADGTLFVGSSEGKLYALDRDGNERWRLDLGDDVLSSSIGADGTLYVTAGGVHAVSPAGALLWSTLTGTAGAATAVLGRDGSIYVGRGKGIYALNADGSLEWDYRTGDITPATPAIGLDGRIWLSSYDDTLYVFEETRPANGGYDGSPWPTARGDRRNTGRAGGP